MLARINNLIIDLKHRFMPKHFEFYVVGLMSLLLTSPFAFRDPEPHHDGIQYGAAVGVAEGLEIQLEIFSQYGPVTAWLQGFTLWLLGPELIWIRLLNALLIAATAMFTYLIIESLVKNRIISTILPIAWVASSPDWSLAPGIFQFWPWPSTLFGCLAVVSLYFWIRSRDFKDGHSYRLLFLAGLLVGISGFTRSQNGLLLYLALAFSIAVIDRRDADNVKKFVRFSLGVFTSGGSIVLYFLVKGSLDDFINQAIIGSADRYTGKLYNLETLVQTYLIPAIFYALICTLVYFSTISVKKWHKFTFAIWAGILLFILVVLYVFSEITWVNQYLIQYDLISGLSVTPMLLSTMCAVGVVVTPAMLSMHNILIKRRRVNTSQYRISVESDDVVRVALGISATGLASISQIFPMHDPYHLWWAAPTPIVSVIACSNALGLNKIALLRSFNAMALVSLMIGLVLWNSELSEPRVKLSNGSLKHMYVVGEREPENKKIVELLSSVDTGSATFYCRDGLVSAWTGRYMSSSPRFVDWAWGTLEVKPKPDERVFLCVYDSMESGLSWADQNGYVFGKGVQTNFSYFSSFYFVELIKKSG
jgi:hypothetical protein